MRRQSKEIQGFCKSHNWKRLILRIYEDFLLNKKTPDNLISQAKDLKRDFYKDMIANKPASHSTLKKYKS